MATGLNQGCAVSFAVGVALHLALFRVGEWDTWSFRLLLSVISLQAGLSLLSYQQHADLLESAQHGLYLVGAGILGVWSSMTVYRVFFHRLRHFPGPFWARLSTFYMTGLALNKQQIYENIQKMHNEYGDYVRVGPTEISIADPNAFNAIHSGSSPCTRGPWYNILNPTVSLQMVRDNKEHARRRKAWDRAFSSKALRDYEGRVNVYTDQLLGAIERGKEKAMNVSKWFNFYSFDVMGDLAFGKGFDMLKDDIEHYFYKTTHANMVLIGTFSRIVWLFSIFKAIPLVNHEYTRFQRWVRATTQTRIANKPHVPDVFSWILKDYQASCSPSWQETENLYGDASLIVIAGSDTTAATLTCLFYQFALHPEKYRMLQKEVDDFMASAEGVTLDHAAFSKLEYLQACIDESLRLYPPVMSGLQRMTPPAGLHIGNRYIPGNTIVQMPSYTLCRDPRSFPRGNEFIPERWITQPELIKDATVYTPFSVGRFSCVGKQLGLMEVRRVTALIAQRYDVRLAAEQNPRDFPARMKDCFTLASPTLNLVFSPRPGGVTRS